MALGNRRPARAGAGIRTGVAAIRHEKDPYDKAYWLERGETQLRVFGNGPYWGTVTERFRETRQAYLENGDAWFWTIMGTTLTIGFMSAGAASFKTCPSTSRAFAASPGGPADWVSHCRPPLPPARCSPTTALEKSPFSSFSAASSTS